MHRDKIGDTCHLILEALLLDSPVSRTFLLSYNNSLSCPPLSSARLRHGHAIQGCPRSSRKQSSQIHKAFNSASDPPGRSAFVNNISCFYLSGLRFLIRTLLAAQTILQGRLAAENILKGDDDRLLVVVGWGKFFYFRSHPSLFFTSTDRARFTMSKLPLNTLSF